MRSNYITMKICLKSLGLEIFYNNYIDIAKSSCVLKDHFQNV